jgi:DNA invertase Pin-like site-specific DNA recombinase
MKTEALKLVGTGAAYIRVSLEIQDDERQRKDIALWCERHGVTIKPDFYYVDRNYTRDEAEIRPDFNRLLEDAKSGRVNWIVVTEDDRFGTKNLKQLVHYLYLLDEAGCKLYNVRDKELTSDDFADFINIAVKGKQSEDERRTLADRVGSAMREQAGRGEWGGGYIPYGMDVVCFGRNDMSERWRVQIAGRDLRIKINADGTRRNFDGKNNFPPREELETFQLRPTTNTALLDNVRKLFERFASEEINYNQLAKSLNDQGYSPYYAEYFGPKNIERILANPVYTGYPTWNKNSYAKYSAWKDGRRVDRKPGQGAVANDPTDWIKPDAPLFDPVVDPVLFQKVQDKLKRLAETDHKSRAPRSAKLWLRGLVICGSCGAPMSGRIDQRTKKPGYIYSTYVNFRGDKTTKRPCEANCTSHDLIEEKVREYLNDTAPAITALLHSDRPKSPASLTNAIMDALNNWTKMRRAVIEKYGPQAIRDLNSDTQERQLMMLYRSIFDSTRADDRARLDQIKAEYRAQTIGLVRIKSETQRGILVSYLAELEEEIADLESRTHNAADAYTTASQTVRELSAAWEEAIGEIHAQTSARRKASAISKVISQIVLRHEPSGLKNPRTVLRRLEIVPHGATGSDGGSQGGNGPKNGGAPQTSGISLETPSCPGLSARPSSTWEFLSSPGKVTRGPRRRKRLRTRSGGPRPATPPA